MAESKPVIHIPTDEEVRRDLYAPVPVVAPSQDPAGNEKKDADADVPMVDLSTLMASSVASPTKRTYRRRTPEERAKNEAEKEERKKKREEERTARQAKKEREQQEKEQRKKEREDQRAAREAEAEAKKQEREKVAKPTEPKPLSGAMDRFMKPVTEQPQAVVTTTSTPTSSQAAQAVAPSMTLDSFVKPVSS
jgi:chromatin assembly factor 1 subunit A